MNRRKRVRVEFFDGSTESFYCIGMSDDSKCYWFNKTFARPFGQTDLDSYEQIKFERRHVKSVRYKYVDNMNP